MAFGYEGGSRFKNRVREYVDYFRLLELEAETPDLHITGENVDRVLTWLNTDIFNAEPDLCDIRYVGQENVLDNNVVVGTKEVFATKLVVDRLNGSFIGIGPHKFEASRPLTVEVELLMSLESDLERGAYWLYEINDTGQFDNPGLPPLIQRLSPQAGLSVEETLFQLNKLDEDYDRVHAPTLIS
jgi:hypothetical protein